MGYYISLNKMAFVGLIKAIDKLWHRGLLFTLEQNGIRGTY